MEIIYVKYLEAEIVANINETQRSNETNVSELIRLSLFQVFNLF